MASRCSNYLGPWMMFHNDILGNHKLVKCDESDLIGLWMAFRTYGNAWMLSLKVHEMIGEQRLHFADNVADVANDLHLLIENMEEKSKQVHVKSISL